MAGIPYGSPRQPKPKDTRQFEVYQMPKGIAGPPAPTGKVRFPSSGVTLDTKSGSYKQPDTTDYSKALQDYLTWTQAAAANANGSAGMGAMYGGNAGGGGRGGGGGGGSVGPDLNQVRALADSAFAFNTGPYDLMRQQVANQRGQAQGYNPDFAAQEAQFRATQQGLDQTRAAAVQQRLQALAGFGQQLAGTQSGAMSNALRDLSAQGVNVNPYVQQANQIAGERTAGLANQGQYLGQLNASAANTAAGYGQASGLIRQGGEATLANNRGTLLNQLAQQEGQIGIQQAQAQQAQDQARREFLLKYGVS